MNCRAVVNSLSTAALLAVATVAWADGTAPQIQQLVAELDSADFHVRESAVRRLREMVLAERGAQLAAQLDQSSLDPRLSFETHQQLDEILRDVPRDGSTPSETLSEDATRELMAQLCDDRFSTRENAARRLRRLLNNPDNIVPVLLSLKSRLNDASIPAATLQELERHREQARRAWLLAPAEKCALPAIADEQIAGWIKLVAQPVENEPNFVAQRNAFRELEDALVRDDCRDRAIQALNLELAATDDPAGTARLQDLVDLTRPALVAEIWGNLNQFLWVGGRVLTDQEPFSVRHQTTQYLHVGVPQFPQAPGAVRATHFASCDDKVARCLSGNSLLPGDYPVGVAIPHPDGSPVIFHLVNLPTPRRRLIYEYSARRGEAVRLRELSQRTCDAFLNKVQKLTDIDASLLMRLDHVVVSNFASAFFAKVDDVQLGGLGNHLPIGETSQHGAVCYALAFTGTKDAAPGLIKAIADKRILPADESAHYNLPPIALLAIAQRDPWEKVNGWLDAQLDQDEPLVNNVDPAPDLAATAAAILGDRLGQSFQSLGLKPVSDSVCQQAGFTPCRFESEDQRATTLKLLRAPRREITAP